MRNMMRHTAVWLLWIVLMVLWAACSSAPRHVPGVDVTVEARVVKERVIGGTDELQTVTPILTPAPVVGTTATPVAGLSVEQVERAPRLKNFLIKNLGPYDPEKSTFGDLKYDIRFGDIVFNEFGMLRIDEQGNSHYNPTFEFKAPADTLMIAPISGVISYTEWQPSQGDWEIHIKPMRDSEWRLGIDHVVSLDCARSANSLVMCDSPLKINGNDASAGMSVSAGDVIGYVGNWSDYDDIGINGRTELTVFKYFDEYRGAMNYCPTLYLAEGIGSDLKATISELMQSYEEWSKQASTYDQEKMTAPGCLYEAIKQIGDKTEPILPIPEATAEAKLQAAATITVG